MPTQTDQSDITQIVVIAIAASTAIIAASTAAIHFYNRRTANRAALTNVIKDVISMRNSASNLVEELIVEKLKTEKDDAYMQETIGNYISEFRGRIELLTSLREGLDKYFSIKGMSFFGPSSDKVDEFANRISSLKIEHEPLDSEYVLRPNREIKKLMDEIDALQHKIEVVSRENTESNELTEQYKHEIVRLRANIIRLSQEAVQHHLNAIQQKD